MSVACSVRRGRRQPLTPGKHYLMKKSPGSLRASAQRTLTRSLRSRELCSVLLKHTTKKEGKTGWRETFCFSVSSILMLIVSKICYLSGGSLQTKVIVGIIENSVLSHLKGGRLEWKHVNDSDLYGELWETQRGWGWFCNRGFSSSITERLAQTSSDLWKWKITPELSALSRRSPDLYATFGLYESQYLPLFTSEGNFTSRLRHTAHAYIGRRDHDFRKSKASRASNEPTSMRLLKSLPVPQQ